MPKRNVSIITLDMKPGQWRELFREEAGREVWGTGGGEERGEVKGEEQSTYPGAWEGGWEEKQKYQSGWEDDSRNSSSSYKRLVSMDVKQLDSREVKGSRECF